MKILIFGVTGNCGKYVSSYFISKGAEVWGVGRRKDLKSIPSVKYISGSIEDKSLFKKLPCDFDLVINFAGVQPSILKTSENTSYYETLQSYVDVNIVGTFNVIEWVSKNKIGTYIYSSTHRDFELYWQEKRALGNNEPVAINYKGDHSMYAISKVVGQMMGDYIIGNSEVRCFNLRLPMMFLVPDHPTYLLNGAPAIMPFLKLIKDATESKTLEIWGDPNLPRDYVYIDNLVSLINGCHESNISGGTFSVGTGEGVTTENFVKEIGSVFGNGSSIDLKYVPEKKTYKSAVYDVSEQRELLNYTPILLNEMLQKMKFKIDSEKYFEKWGWK